jgi:hypothetical protein
MYVGVDVVSVNEVSRSLERFGSATSVVSSRPARPRTVCATGRVAAERFCGMLRRQGSDAEGAAT